MNLTNAALAALLKRLALVTEKRGSVHEVLEPLNLELNHVLAEAARRLIPTQPDIGNIIEIPASDNELRLICAANKARKALQNVSDDDAYFAARTLYRTAIDTGLGPLLPRLASSAAQALNSTTEPKKQTEQAQ